MPGPYIRDGHYMYGNAFIQPYPAYYNSSWYHRKPPRRFISDLSFHDDGCLYKEDPPADDEAPVMRSGIAGKIINIETLAFRSLRIKLYAMEEKDDIDLVLEIGKQYAITYISEGGLKVANGILKVIDASIPDECVRYIGQFNETVATAWIGMDCSSAGKSDKRKIFIASIRGIEEVPEDDESYIPPTIDVEDMSDSSKLNAILNIIPDFSNRINQILVKVKDNDQIMDKLAEMDPSERIEYIISLLEDDSKFEDIKSHIDSKIDEAMNIHSEAVMNKFAELLDKLGNMDYGDKINYLYMEAFDENEQTALLEKINSIKEDQSTLDNRTLTIKDRQEAILNKLEAIYNNTKPNTDEP